MWEFIWKQYKKYEEAINYLFFGVLAFVVNTAVYWVAARAMGVTDESQPPFLIFVANAIAWVTAVIFAYWTNRTFVFKSQIKDANGRFKEFTGFIGARIATGILDTVILLLATYLGVNDLISKIVSNFFVIVCNYIFSKLFVFKKTDKTDSQKEEARKG